MMKHNCNSSAGELALQQGMTAARAGFTSLAIAQLERAAELLPDNATVWLWLAWLANSPHNTRRCLHQVLELSPNHPAAKAGLNWITLLTAEESNTGCVETKVVDEASAFFDSTAKFRIDLEAPNSVRLESVAVDPMAAAPMAVEGLVEMVTERLPQSVDLRDGVDSSITAEIARSQSAITLDADGWEVAAPTKSDVANSTSALNDAMQPPAESSDTEDSIRRRWSDLVSRTAELPQPDGLEAASVIQVSVTEPSTTATSAVIAETSVEVPDPEAVVPSRFTDMSIAARRDDPLPTHDPDILKPRAVVLARSKEAQSEISADIETLTQSFNPSTDVVAADGRPLVLVVDDSPTVRKLVSLTLERRGYRVITAFDGVAAIKELGTHRPDLILLDINMPRLDGYRLCKLIKKHEATQSIPVVMLSGKDGMFDKLRGRLVGCSDYITKPFEADALTHKVAKYLSPVVANSL